MPQCLLTI